MRSAAAGRSRRDRGGHARRVVTQRAGRQGERGARAVAHRDRDAAARARRDPTRSRRVRERAATRRRAEREALERELAAASAEVQAELARGVELSAKADAAEAGAAGRARGRSDDRTGVGAHPRRAGSAWCRRSRTPRLVTRPSSPPPGGGRREPRPRGGPPREPGAAGQPDREADRGRGARALRRAAVRRLGRAAGGGRGRAASSPDGEGVARPAVGAPRRRRSPRVDATHPERSPRGPPLVHPVHQGARARREEVALTHLGAHADHEVQEGLEGPGAADQAADGRGAPPGPHGRRPGRGRLARARRRGAHDQADRPRGAAEARRGRVGHRRRPRRPHRQPAAGRRRRLAPRRAGRGRPAPLLRRPHRRRARPSPSASAA